LVVFAVFRPVQRAGPEPGSVKGVDEGHGEQAAVDPSLVSLADHVELAEIDRSDQDGTEFVAEAFVSVVVAEERWLRSVGS
jgi:hypothetical protein